jgi:hypothetical protein
LRFPPGSVKSSGRCRETDVRITAEEAVMSGTVIETEFYGGFRAERAAG